MLRDGSAFVAPSKGLYRLNKDGNNAVEVPAPQHQEERVSAVEVVSDRLYVGTPRGLFSAPYDYRRAKLPAKLEPVKGFETADVTAIWGVPVRGRVSTSGPGSARAARTWETGRPCSEVGGPKREWCGDTPREDAVVRSGAGTGLGSFVVVTSGGVYEARPYDAAAGPADSSCANGDLRFQRRITDDTNDAIPVPRAWFPKRVARGANDRTGLVWAGADHGVDLIAFGGTFTSVPETVVATFESSAVLNSNQVSAVATVGTGHNALLLVGTSGGIYAHRPALVNAKQFQGRFGRPETLLSWAQLPVPPYDPRAQSRAGSAQLR